MSDQANPTENTEQTQGVAESMQEELTQQGETVTKPQEGEFEPSGERFEETVEETPSDAGAASGDDASTNGNQAAAEAAQGAEEAEEAMTGSLAAQGETVEQSNTFTAGPGSATVADGATGEASAEASTEASTEAPTEASTEATENGSRADDSTSDPRHIPVTRTNGPAMFELPERMARNRRIYDAKIEDIHYKNIPMLVRFLDTYGRILSRRRTGVSAKMQRRMVQAVKRARELSLLPYTNEHNRLSRKNR